MNEKLVIELKFLRGVRSKQRGNRRRRCLTPSQLERSLRQHADNVARRNGRTTFIVLRYRLFLMDEAMLFCGDWSRVTDAERAVLRRFAEIECLMRVFRDTEFALYGMTDKDVLKDTDRIVAYVGKKSVLQVRGNANLAAWREEYDQLAPLVADIHHKVIFPCSDAVHRVFSMYRKVSPAVVEVTQTALSN